MEDLKKYLKQNKKIEVEKLYQNKKIKRYKTAFYQETSDNLQFYRPYENENKIDFIDNETLRFLIYTTDGVFAFKTKVIKSSQKIIKTQKPKAVRKIQRRGLLRQNLKLKAKIEYKIENKIKTLTLQLLNISGSGISFDCDEDLKGIKQFEISFKIGNKIIKTPSQIVEIRKNTKKLQKYRISAKFIALNNYEIEYIIKNCIKHQIEVRKKSL